MKELKIKMHFYLQMNDGETEEQALKRFNDIMDCVANSPIEHESAFQIFDTEINNFDD